jgi:hypothetical protein
MGNFSIPPVIADGEGGYKVINPRTHEAAWK